MPTAVLQHGNGEPGKNRGSSAASSLDTCTIYLADLGLHSRASRCASASWAGVIFASMGSRA